MSRPIIVNVTPDNADMRISDSDRESAIAALGEHMSAGRLDIDEYGERTARATAAKTRRELISTFEDLPQPHPSFGATPRYAAQPVAAAPPPPPATRNNRQVAKYLPLVFPAVIAAAVALFVLTHIGWVFFLIIPAAIVFGGGRGGGHRHGGRGHWDRDRWDRRDRRYDRMDSRMDRMSARYNRY